MTQLDSNISSPDLGFRPKLSKHAKGGYKTFAKLYGMANVGIPVPTHDKASKLALWYATVPNHLGELGLLAVSAPKNVTIVPEERLWYCGLIPGDVYDLSKPDENHAGTRISRSAELDLVTERELQELELAKAIIDFADHGPLALYSQNGNPGALDLLQALYRK